MNSKQRKVLQAIFERPVRADLQWKDIELLFASLGAVIEEGSGSRLKVALNGVVSVYHRPHPRKETDKGAVRDVCDFLTKAGIEP